MCFLRLLLIGSNVIVLLFKEKKKRKGIARLSVFFSIKIVCVFFYYLPKFVCFFMV